MLGAGGDSVLFPPFGRLGDEMPPIIPLLHLCLEKFIVLRVDGGGICDGLGRGRDWEFVLEMAVVINLVTDMTRLLRTSEEMAGAAESSLTSF